MADTIPYMGTKRELSAAVVCATESCREGGIVDLFAGMGSVAAAHSATRPVWANDIQHFAYLNNKCRLQYNAPDQVLTSAKMDALVDEHLSELRNRARGVFAADERAARSDDYNSFASLREIASDRSDSFDDLYSCFITRYSTTYFSSLQCGEIDSIRFALERLRGIGAIGERDFDWGVLCLGAAMLRCANTTGHFAQYLKLNPGNWRRIQRQARKSVFTTWKSCIIELKPFGDRSWRDQNRVTRLDAGEALQNHGQEIGVVYCDPPYTDDQYSRFYHIWETLVLYDYPELSGIGLYRPGRFRTDFSLISKVANAFEKLIKSVAETGADLVLSYPSDGLLHETGVCPLDLISQYFSRGLLLNELEHAHSSMGASSGSQKNIVFERIYVGYAE